MRTKIPAGAFILLITLLPVAGISHQQRLDPGRNAPVPIAGTTYTTLPLGAVRPKGWLLHQLQIMRNGTTGHLDEVYDKLKKDNGWLGGKGDGWEETPYWLDGAVPLAYELDDAQLKAKVLRYINWTLDHQRPSGYFGPVTKEEREQGIPIGIANAAQGEDWWPKMVMLKVLKQYYTATRDPRVIPFMTRYFHYQLATLKKNPLDKWSEWAAARGMDNVMIVRWLYWQTKDSALLPLEKLLVSQTFPWSEWLGGRTWVMNAAANQTGKDWMQRHGVNVAMGLKAPAINYERTHDPKYLYDINTGFRDLMTLHGLPNGIFSADEDLHGNNPIQGTELCAIVEAMFSLEQIIAVTGDPYYMDALERIAFNALPPQTTDDYNNKQYYQVANQVEIARGSFNFSLDAWNGTGNVLGMRSGYTCCLANMHQGWTKFVEHLWYAAPGKGLAALEYSPCELHTTIGNIPVTIEEQTAYPFSGTVQLKIHTKQPVRFPLSLRIPGWCKKATLLLNDNTLRSDTGGQVITVDRLWKDNDEIALQFPMEVFTSNWAGNSRTIERGPLVYALKLGEQWVKGNDARVGEYYSVYPQGHWNYALTAPVIQDPVKQITVEERPVTDSFIWNEQYAPVELTADAKKLPGWKLTNGIAYQPVSDRSGFYRGEVSDTVEKIQLIPYGCTKVRIVAFPVVK